VGNTHLDNNPTLPEEKKKIGLIYFGEDEDFFTLKGTLEELFEYFGIDAQFTRGGGNYLQPGRKALITANGALLGEIGAVHPDVLKAFDVNARAYVAELDFQTLSAQKNTKKAYQALPRFPVVLRDVAVIADESVEAETLRQVILHAPVGELMIENVALFDVYRGANIGENRKSLAFSFSLRTPDHTLTDEEISSAMEAVIMALHDAGANLRE
jgi:phenylalanyl-tRNA synthetase beta chain